MKIRVIVPGKEQKYPRVISVVYLIDRKGLKVFRGSMGYEIAVGKRFSIVFHHKGSHHPGRVSILTDFRCKLMISDAIRAWLSVLTRTVLI